MLYDTRTIKSQIKNSIMFPYLSCPSQSVTVRLAVAIPRYRNLTNILYFASTIHNSSCKLEDKSTFTETLNLLIQSKFYFKTPY